MPANSIYPKKRRLEGEFTMQVVYNGKTKSVLVDEETGDHFLFFKDDATGENGVYDPGSNTVGGRVSGKGKKGLLISKYFFELMAKNNIPTHYLGVDVDQCLMRVRSISVPKLEFVLRYFTAGSMCRRFSLEAEIPFDPPYVEVTLKDDDQGDPLISERLCIMKGLLKEGDYQKAVDLLIKAGEILRNDLKDRGFTLIDFKIEVGFDEQGNIYVADEITPDIWRVKEESGNIPNQVDCAEAIIKGMLTNPDIL